MKTKSKKKTLIIVLVSIAVLLVALCSAVLIVGHNLLSPMRPKGGISDDAIVETDKGKIQGRENDGVYNFLGVEYGYADHFFELPKEVEKFDGVKKATDYGPASLQASNSFSFLSSTQYSNSCQNLNIWAPEKKENLPVMVFLHGGGFSSGSSYQMDSYNGENLAKKGNVVVTINHRLNVIGHLDLSDYGEEYQCSANVGIADIVLALQWIKKNITSFGGNKENVTLFGQSGGGAKILALMTSPYGKGLFHKAIIQSGATETVGVHFNSLEVSKKVTEYTMKNLGITDPKGIEELGYRKLLSASNDALSKVAMEYKIPSPFQGYSMEFEPVVDGDYIPSDPIVGDSFAENGKDITLMIGSNLFEWTKYVSSLQVEVTDDINAEFKKAYPDKMISDARYVDTLIRVPMLKLMRAKARQAGAKIYSYVYTYGNSTHGAEIPYTFNNGSGVMNDMLSSLWSNFAKDGVPS